MNETNRGGVWAVVVTFRPDHNVLDRLLRSLEPQVNGIIIVDNGSSAATLEWLTVRQCSVPCHLFPLGDNLGIAKAQNVGIDAACEQGADFVILFDHDSHPSPDMVERLLAVARSKQAAGVALAAVGPRYFDERQDNPPPFIQIEGMKVRRMACTGGDSVVPVDYLIASGCLIPMATLKAVGGKCEELFIDYVDIEWGLRARSRGFQAFGACGAHMGHDLGDEPIRFLGKNYPLHSALRHYYHFRNAVWLYRQDWLPLNWKLADGYRLILKYGFYTLFAKPRHKHWWMMTKGVWHGLVGRMGRLN